MGVGLLRVEWVGQTLQEGAFQLACRGDLACPVGGVEGRPRGWNAGEALDALDRLRVCCPTGHRGFYRELRSGNGDFCSEGSSVSWGRGTGV